MIEPYGDQPGQSEARPPTAMLSRAIPASSDTITILVLALAALLALAPALVFPVPPLADYPNHLARMHVIGTIGADPDLARYYEIHWRIIPNLAMDVVVPQLARIVDIYHAGQIYAVACLALIVSGVFVLNRALFGRWSVLSVAVLPFLYNHILFLGSMNYWTGVGLALWAAAVWVGLRDRAWPWRLAASTLLASALFFTHLFAAGIYGMMLLAFELWRLWHRRSIPLPARLADFVATGVPFLPFLPLLMISPTLGLAGTNQWSLPAKLEGLYFAVSTYSDRVDFALVAAIAAVLGWAASRRELRVHPAGWILIGIGAAVYLAMPNVLFDTYVADERLPAALVIVALTFFSLDAPRAFSRHAVAALLVLLLAARVAEVGVNWTALARQTADVRASTEVHCGTRRARARRSVRSDLRERGVRFRARACRLPRDHRALRVRGERVRVPRQADHGGPAGVPADRRARRRRPADHRAAGGGQQDDGAAGRHRRVLAAMAKEFRLPVPDVYGAR